MRIGAGVGPVYASTSGKGCLTSIGGAILLPFAIIVLVIKFLVMLVKLIVKALRLAFMACIVTYAAVAPVVKSGYRKWKTRARR